jgi:predicted nucleic acid-binding protein
MIQASSSLVVDASIAAKWHLPGEPDTEKALQLLEQFRLGAVSLFAPMHILYEVASAIMVATRGAQARLSTMEGEQAIDAFLGVGIRTIDGPGLIRAAHLLAGNIGIAFYDALYVALAERLRLPFITADRRLHLRIAHRPDIIWLTDWPRRDPDTPI